MTFYFWLGAEAERVKEEQNARAALAIKRAWYDASNQMANPYVPRPR